MENKKVENKFAMHLSGVLEKMNYEQGIAIIQSIAGEAVAVVHNIEELGANDNYTIRFEVLLNILNQREMMLNRNHVKQLEKYGIEDFYYRIEINPSEDEMEEFLEEFSYEYDEDDLLNETIEAVKEQFDSYDFDEVLSYFEDTKVEWDVLIDKDYNFYRAGKDEVMSY